MSRYFHRQKRLQFSAKNQYGIRTKNPGYSLITDELLKGLKTGVRCAKIPRDGYFSDIVHKAGKRGRLMSADQPKFYNLKRIINYDIKYRMSLDSGDDEEA